MDLAALRADTPGAGKTIHLNAAGASLQPAPVLGAVHEHLAAEAEWGGYEAAERRAEAVDDVYLASAEMLNCAPEEVAFVENATRGWDMAFYALPLGPSDRILTSVSEYASNYIAYLQVARRTGASLEVIPNDGSGQISSDGLAEMLDERVKLVAITHVPTNGGLVNPAAAIGALTRKAGVTFLLDACQSAGQMALDVEEIGCDLLSFTGRKYIRGPRGTGILYARRELADRLEPPLLDLRAAIWTGSDSYELAPGARRFENWECNVAGKAGLGRAIRYALEVGLEAIEERVGVLAERLRAGLEDLAGVTVQDQGEKRCGIVSFTVADRHSRDVREALRDLGIAVWHAEAASTLLDMRRRGLESVVRSSVHYYNTEEEVDALVEAVRNL
jgi:selenocysteine lyase/cysteine desulfurase